MFNKKFFKVFFYFSISVVGLIVIFYLGNYLIIRNSNEYDLAKQYIISNPDVINKIGEIKSFGNFPSGGISTVNGRKTAQIEMYVVGSKKSGKITVIMTREPGEDWDYNKIYFKE